MDRQQQAGEQKYLAHGPKLFVAQVPGLIVGAGRGHSKAQEGGELGLPAGITVGKGHLHLLAEGVIGKGLVKAMQHKRKASILFSPRYDAPQFLREVHTLQETSGFFQKRQGKMGTFFQV